MLEFIKKLFSLSEKKKDISENNNNEPILKPIDKDRVGREVDEFLAALFSKTSEVQYSNNLDKKVKKLIDEYILDIVLDDRIYTKDKQRDISSELITLSNLFSKDIGKFWLINKLKIAFVGKFSAGKSSIINALIGEDLLLTDITPTTAIPSFITYVNYKGSHFFALDYMEKIRKLDFKLLKKLHKEEISKFPIPLPALIRYFVIPINLDFLFDKVIIDTPGYNPGEGSDSWDEKRTVEAINESDVIFWILDINDGDISKDSLKFIKQNITNQLLYIIVNKCDTKPPPNVNKIIKKIEKTLKNADINYKDILPFSAKKPESYIKNIISIVNSLSINDSYHSFIEYVENLVDDSTSLLTSEMKKYFKFYTELERLKKSKEMIDLINQKESTADIIDELIEKAEFDTPIFGEDGYKINRNDFEDIIESVNIIIKKMEEYHSIVLNFVEKYKDLSKFKPILERLMYTANIELLTLIDIDDSNVQLEEPLFGNAFYKIPKKDFVSLLFSIGQLYNYILLQEIVLNELTTIRDENYEKEIDTLLSKCKEAKNIINEIKIEYREVLFNGS